MTVTTTAKRHNVYILCGPTASGKSGLAVLLAQKHPANIINADSTQIYDGLRVLTARPSPDEEALAPHFLYGTVAPNTVCSATKWRALALREVYQTIKDKHIPILVGGTGFYLKTLLEGLAPIPETPIEFRREAEELYSSYGGNTFHAKLTERDPETGTQLHPNDRQRLVRAWEVLEHTGTPLSEWKKMPKIRPPDDLHFRIAVLMPEREWLYQRCDLRFDQMLAAGAMDEVRAFLARGVKPDRPIHKVIGLRELSSVLARELTLEEATEQAKQATRHYAKRQMTWLRGQVIADANLDLCVFNINAQTDKTRLVNGIENFFFKGEKWRE